MSRNADGESGAKLGPLDPRYRAVVDKRFNKRFIASPDYVRLVASTAIVAWTPCSIFRSHTLITFILPGLSNSGPEHWQSHWERMDSTCRRIMQAEWEEPSCEDWAATLDHAVSLADDAIVLVGHSSACALVAHWASAEPDHIARVRGALLVGPSDPEGPNYPAGPTGFAPMPRRRLPFRSTVVASRDDRYVDLEQARSYAAAWGSTFVDIGAAGHINAASKLGEWPAGYSLLEDLRRGA